MLLHWIVFRADLLWWTSYIFDKVNLFMTFLTASSCYSIFTQVPKTFNSTVALQVGFLKMFLGDVATILLDLVCLSLFCFFMSFQTDWTMIRSDLCVEHWLLSEKISHWIITINWKNECLEMYISYWHTTAKDRNNLLKTIFFDGENTSVLLILATTVYMCIYICMYIYIYIYIYLSFK